MREHLVEPGTRIRVIGTGRILNATTDAEIAAVDGGIAEITIPENCRVIIPRPLLGQQDADLDIEVIPPDSTESVAAVEPDRWYTVCCENSVSIRANTGETLLELPREEQRVGEFLSPPDCIAVIVTRDGHVKCWPSPLTRADLRPELDALNAKIRRKGFKISIRRSGRVAGGDGNVVTTVDEVGLAPRDEMQSHPTPEVPREP